MRMVAAVLCVFFLSGCGDSKSGADIVINDTASEDVETVTRAIDIFKTQCPDLFNKYWSDVVSAQASIVNNVKWRGYRLDLYGWEKEINLKVTLSEELSHIPNTYRAWGHDLFYNLGGGKRPGIDISKVPAQQICGFAIDGQSNVFVSAPQLALLDNLSH